MGKFITYETGYKFPDTRLTYIKDVEVLRNETKYQPRRAIFKCECGNQIEVEISWVRHLNTRSCGCLRSEIVTDKNIVHGHASRDDPSGAYRSWHAMHLRAVTNPLYKDRQVCERWSGENGFQNFLQDMGDRPEKHSIERVRNNEGYKPDNCKWATPAEQALNTNANTRVTIDGKTLTIIEWCRVKGIGYPLVKQRRARGMSLNEAITTPIDESKQPGGKAAGSVMKKKYDKSS